MFIEFVVDMGVSFINDVPVTLETLATLDTGGRKVLDGRVVVGRAVEEGVTLDRLVAIF